MAAEGARVDARGVPLLLVAALVGGKAAQLAWWPDSDGSLLGPGLVRQAALAGPLALAVWCARAGPKRPPGAHQTPPRRAAWALAAAGVGAALQLATDPPGLAAANLVVVTALGEEILFRGLLPAAVAGATRRPRLVAALAFGAWHVPDAWSGGPLAVAGAVALTTVAAGAFFEPLRRRTGTVLAPAALHAALNAIGIAVRGW